MRDPGLIKTKEEIAIMAEGGHILAQILKALATATKPGVSTGELDALAEKLCREYGVIPTCKGYYGFPAAICTCVNDVVEHGIPSQREPLKSGDIITLDMVVKHKGLNTDAALTVPVGDVSQEALAFIETVKKARDDAIAIVRPGRHIGDISAVMEFTVRSKGYTPVREMTGHGIGVEMHEDPDIPCYGLPGTGPEIREGMVLAIEAIIASGKPQIEISRKDGWTARTKDASIAAVFEHTVAVLKNGYRILTV